MVLCSYLLWSSTICRWWVLISSAIYIAAIVTVGGFDVLEPQLAVPVLPRHPELDDDDDDSSSASVAASSKKAS